MDKTGYSAQDWVLIIGALFTGLTGLATVILQLVNNAKSRANGVKLSANLAQTAEVARATDGADVLPQTAAIINKETKP